MKTLVVAALLLGLAAHHAASQGAQGAQITQRARDLANQNNERQGVQKPPPVAPPAHQAPKPAPQTAPRPVPQAKAASSQFRQEHINTIKADITALLAGASQEKNNKLAADLALAARGPNKPSQAALSKLANSLGSNLASKVLKDSEQLRLAEDLEAIVNGGKMSPLEADAYSADLQAVLKLAGVKADPVLSIVNDAKAVMTEIRR